MSGLGLSIPKPTKWTVLSVFPVSPLQLKDRDRTLRLSWLFAMSDNDRPRRGLRRLRALLATLTSAVDDVIADACHRSAKKQKSPNELQRKEQFGDENLNIDLSKKGACYTLKRVAIVLKTKTQCLCLSLRVVSAYCLRSLMHLLSSASASASAAATTSSAQLAAALLQAAAASDSTGVTSYPFNAALSQHQLFTNCHDPRT